jgi:hypothetical protein
MSTLVKKDLRVDTVLAAAVVVATKANFYITN